MDALTYSTNGKNLNTNDELTLKSTALRTASIGNMTGNTITGMLRLNVISEQATCTCKIMAVACHPYARANNIKQAWQENATVGYRIPGNAGSAGNPKPDTVL